MTRATWQKRTLEETIVKVIMDGLVACRIPIYRVRERISRCPRCREFVGKPSEPGIPDLVGYVPNPGSGSTKAIPVFIEVKRPMGGVESEAQKEFIDRAKRGGAIAFFARGWDECAEQLKAAGVRVPF